MLRIEVCATTPAEIQHRRPKGSPLFAAPDNHKGSEETPGRWQNEITGTINKFRENPTLSEQRP